MLKDMDDDVEFAKQCSRAVKMITTNNKDTHLISMDFLKSSQK